jgi:hypothetical protein
MKELLAMAFDVALALGAYAAGLYMVLIIRNAFLSRDAASMGSRRSEPWYSMQSLDKLHQNRSSQGLNSISQVHALRG